MNHSECVIRSKNFRFAAVFSLTAHLFFVATVEGAVFLNRIFSSDSQEPFIYFNLEPVSPEPANRSAEGLIGKIEIPITGMTPPQTENSAHALWLKESLDTAPFSKSQLEIDQKIEKVREHLEALSKRSSGTESQESLNSYVSDLEKVPSDARRDLLPAYLKQMRAKIASVWLLIVQAQRIDSGSVALRYRIKPDGSVFDLQVLGVQGSKAFQEACLSAVRGASPFDPLPFAFSKGLKDPHLTIELTFFLERSKKKISIY